MRKRKCSDFCATVLEVALILPVALALAGPALVFMAVTWAIDKEEKVHEEEVCP